MPLFVADYATRAAILLHAANAEHAMQMLEAVNENEEPPLRFHEVPPGIFLAELYVEDDDSEVETYAESDIIPNPANHSQVGYVFEPLHDGLTDWISLMLKTSHEAPAKTMRPPEANVAEQVGTAPTEEPPPPTEEETETSL